MATPRIEDESRRPGPLRRHPLVGDAHPRPAPVAGTPSARTLLDIFTLTVARHGERVAIDAPERSLTYRELATTAGTLAGRLRAEGVGPGDRVGIRVRSGTAELYVAILGVLCAGASYVPADADDPELRGAEMFDRAGACAVIRDGLEVARLRPARGYGRKPTPDDDAWVIFTSGSTGTPKGVAITHRSAAAFVDAEARLVTVAPEDRVLAGLSVAFDASCEEMWLAWRNGAALVPAPRALVRSGMELGPWIAGRAITIVSTVPSLAALWDPAALAGVRLLILGGEACPEALGWRLAAEREVWNTYGPTEATVVSTAARIHPGQPVTIGWPLGGYQVAVLDPAGRPVALGDEGELVIAGVGVGRYLSQTLDAERFAAVPSLGWERAYRSGDIVRETANGLEFVGRSDHQVKIAGRRLELGEVDALLSTAPGVRAAVTVVRESQAGNKLLVSYVLGDAPAEALTEFMSERAPAGIAPMIVALDELPRAASGKIDRARLPWPPPDSADRSTPPTGTAAWLAERWKEQLGPVPVGPDSDFFALGGSSLAAAKLVSELRSRFPAVAVADVYNHRRLSALTERLEQLEGIRVHRTPAVRQRIRRWQAVQLAGVLALLALSSPPWLLGILAFDHWQGGGIGPQLGWGWLIGGWVVFVSAPGRALMVLLARRLLLPDLRPGRYPRRSWLACRIWFVERLADKCQLERLAGTPWSARYARFCGHRVGRGARLGTLPSATSLVRIGARATIEPAVDLDGWWIDGEELVVDVVEIGAAARIGTRALLMPGSRIGDGAEVEPGSVIDGVVAPGERWAGVPAAHVGRAGAEWPDQSAPPPRRRGLWKAMYGIAMAFENLLPLIAALPGVALLIALAPTQWTMENLASRMLVLAPVLTASFIVAYGALVALMVRALASMIRPGWHADQGSAAWAMWCSDELVASTQDALFPVYASIYTRRWLRLLGIPVGPRTEISTAVGLNHMTSFEPISFAADDVVLACSRARGGWLHIAPVRIGSQSFVGNGAILMGGTAIAERSLIGLLTLAPRHTVPGSCWLGTPALELPRIAPPRDRSRTTHPPRRLVLARGLWDLIRILLPGSISVMLAALVFWTLTAIGAAHGVWAMAVATPATLLVAGLCATLITAAIKWVLIGRYRPGEHPLWSAFVWRDEIINTCQEQLAGAWLLDVAMATPLLSAYLRLMGAKVGRDVWCETLTITEFDLAALDDGCTVNRHAVVETHLFHDRVMQIGPATLGAFSTLGPSTAMLPETELGEGCSVGAAQSSCAASDCRHTRAGMVPRLWRCEPPAGAPAVRLLEAGDPGKLRARARAVSAGSDSPCTSRAYRQPYALVASHEAAVGVDIERIELLGRPFLESICTPAELRALTDAGGSAEVGAGLWCSKEALAKGLGDALRYDPRRLEAPLLWPDGRAGGWRAASLLAPPGYVAWVCWREAASAWSRGVTHPPLGLAQPVGIDANAVGNQEI